VQLKFQDLSFSVSSNQRKDSIVPDSFPAAHRGDGGVLEKPNMGVKEVRRINQHIRFFLEESDTSKFSDSIKDYQGDEQTILKIRQKSRKKKMANSMANKKLGATLDHHLEGGQSLSKADKRR